MMMQRSNHLSQYVFRLHAHSSVFFLAFLEVSETQEKDLRMSTSSSGHRDYVYIKRITSLESTYYSSQDIRFDTTISFSLLHKTLLIISITTKKNMRDNVTHNFNKKRIIYTIHSWVCSREDAQKKMVNDFLNSIVVLQNYGIVRSIVVYHVRTDASGFKIRKE